MADTKGDQPSSYEERISEPVGTPRCIMLVLSPLGVKEIIGLFSVKVPGPGRFFLFSLPLKGIYNVQLCRNTFLSIWTFVVTILKCNRKVLSLKKKRST